MSPTAFIPNLTPDGKRVFFESTEALVSTDTDEVQDVYEWEEKGIANCTRTGGCVYLITSGQSERDNFLYAHSRSGNDVFFTTGDVLTGWDSSGGAISIYDARVGGGYPDPEAEDACVADACRPSVTPNPLPPIIQSSAQGRSGNLAPKKPKTCPKGKRKVKKNGKVRCVKNKQKKGKGGKAKSEPAPAEGRASEAPRDEEDHRPDRLFGDLFPGKREPGNCGRRIRQIRHRVGLGTALHDPGRRPRRLHRWLRTDRRRSATEALRLTRDIEVTLPPGMIGNPQNFPRCSLAEFGETAKESKCPVEAQLGVTEVRLAGTSTAP